MSGNKIKSAPQYARTRENMAEFARAAAAAKLLRTTFGSLMNCAVDKGVTGRLMSTMTKVIQGDVVSPRGKRNVRDGKPILLDGFEFNNNASLRSIFLADFKSWIDRITGTMVIDIPAFSPARMISSPEAATHFRLFSAGAAIDLNAIPTT